MDYFLTEQQTMIRETARQLAREKIVPVRAELDEKEEFPWEVIKACAAADLFAIWVPEAYGGLGGGILDLCVCVEELSRACAGVAVSYAASALGTIPIVLFGTEEQKAKYLPDVAAGRKLGAFALTAAGAGSDAAGVRTTARRDGDHYVLNGTKQWITNGGDAETYTVVAITDPTARHARRQRVHRREGHARPTFGKKEVRWASVPPRRAS
jgi:butyryl-CoA dehydrogenase